MNRKIIYSDKQNTLEYEDDFQTQIVTLNTSISMEHMNCAV